MKLTNPRKTLQNIRISSSRISMKKDPHRKNVMTQQESTSITDMNASKLLGTEPNMCYSKNRARGKM